MSDLTQRWVFLSASDYTVNGQTLNGVDAARVTAETERANGFTVGTFTITTGLYSTIIVTSK